MRPIKTGHEQARIWKGYDSDNVKGGRVEDMEAVRGNDGALWSCWKSESLRERISFLIFGKVWIGIRSERLPAVSLVVSRKP